MELYFQGGNQIAILKYEGEGKDRKVEISTALTGFKFSPLSVFFKTKKSREYEKFKRLSGLMKNDQFKNYVIKEFGKMGYQFIRAKQTR